MIPVLGHGDDRTTDGVHPVRHLHLETVPVGLHAVEVDRVVQREQEAGHRLIGDL